ncbi:MAG: hypothetical protein HY321_14440 [Armatimonadetes bacterium]|nr:hypothetical protein [Armatimonadota bacterium]
MAREREPGERVVLPGRIINAYNTHRSAEYQAFGVQLRDGQLVYTNVGNAADPAPEVPEGMELVAADALRGLREAEDLLAAATGKIQELSAECEGLRAGLRQEKALAGEYRDMAEHLRAEREEFQEAHDSLVGQVRAKLEAPRALHPPAPAVDPAAAPGTASAGVAAPKPARRARK